MLTYFSRGKVQTGAETPRPSISRASDGLTGAIAGLILLTAAAVAGHRIISGQINALPGLDVASRSAVSTVVLDRDGQLLRAYTADDDRWRLPLTVSDADPRYLDMLIAYEDARFYHHHGVDVAGVARAGLLALRHGRFVSGASTLTMQVARLLEQRHEKTLPGKWRQMLRAFWLERRYAKTEILNLYLRLAPFGGNLEGARAGALAYFGKEPRRLSAGEAALLVAIPQSPEFRRPDRDHARARAARDKVLKRMARDGVIEAAFATRAMDENVDARRIAFPMHAPHLADRLAQASPGTTVIRSTLARDLQQRLAPLVATHARKAGRKTSGALIVLDNATGEVLAEVGSPGLFDVARNGAVDMTTAIRSPGSALKPFIYGLAFESGLAHPATLIEDRPVRFGTYKPRNFDNQWRGTVSVREALQLSLNVPAVRVLAGVGPARLNARLTSAGVKLTRPSDATPSLALALGGVGLTLEQLGQLYLALANGGKPVAVRNLMDASPAGPPAAIAADTMPTTPAANTALLSPDAAWAVGDILRGAPPPRNARGGQIAFKTGTSYGYRDGWAAGFDGAHTIVAWIGRPDGEPVPGLTGLGTAAPLLFDAFQRVASRRTPFAAPPEGILRARTDSELPPPLRRFRNGDATELGADGAEPPLEITFPPEASQIAMDGESVLQVKASGGRMPMTWLVDGAPIPSARHRRETQWAPQSQGFVRLTVIDADGRTDAVTVRLTN